MISRIIKKTVDLSKIQKVDQLEGPLYQLENGGHTFEITCLMDGAAAAVSGTVSARFLRADEETVYFTGTLTGNVASITLPQSCYNVNGRFGLVVFVAGNDITSAIYAVAGSVYRSTSDHIIDPTEEIPSLEDLIAKIGECEEATADAQQAASFVPSIIASTYSTSVAYVVGDYCTYEGAMYRCTAETDGEFDPADWEAVKVGTEFQNVDEKIDDLKSAITPLQEEINGITFDPGDFTAKAMIIYNTGVKSTTSSTALMATGFIAIPDGATKLFVTMRVVSSTSNTGLAFYTSAEESAFISGSGIRERVATSGWELREITIPDTAKYFRSTYFTDSASVEHPPFAAYTDLAFDNRLDAMQEQIDNAIINTVGVVPVNVYNPDDPDIITGKTVSYNGNFNDVADFKVSGFIEIEPGATYIIPRYTMYFGSSNIRYLPCYNADKTYASSKDMTSSLDTYFRVYTFPANTTYKYFRVNISMYDANSNRIVTPYHTESNFMVIKGTALPNRYIPFVRQRLMDTTVYSAHEELDNPLYGKSIVFFGDSIVEGGDDSGYCRRIGERNSMLWLNNGIGGSTIASTSAGKTICTRAAIMADPDYIVLEGGTNDADRIGNATGETKPANFGTWDPDEYGTDDAETYYGFDITTFCGAVDYMCKRFVSTYPGKKIGFIGAHKMGQVLATRKNRGYYIQTAMDICKKWGIPCLDLWDECYLNPMIPSHYTANEDYLYVDGQHLTHNGYDYITPIIEAWLKTL